MNASVSARASVCVFCGSRPGGHAAYGEAAEKLGAALARNGVELVYGGGSTGLMGEVARSASTHGGRVVGVIPHFLLPREGALDIIDELILVETMHERKMIMFERADAFVALPGGIGTLDELAEQLVWAQLGRHAKPIVLADVNDFWRPLLSLLANMRDEGFLHDLEPGIFQIASDIDDVVALATRDKPRAEAKKLKRQAGP
jgi:uncharacterized protein (TIGR00730 family)